MINIKNCLVAYDELNVFRIIMFGIPTEPLQCSDIATDIFGGDLELHWDHYKNQTTVYGEPIEYGVYVVDMSLIFSPGGEEWSDEMDIHLENIRKMVEVPCRDLEEITNKKDLDYERTLQTK